MSGPRVAGTAHLSFARDIGMHIDLAAARARLLGRTQDALLGRRHAAPAWFEFDPPPLRVPCDAPALDAGRWRTRPGVEAVLYEFGAVSITFALPFEGPLEELVELSCELTGDGALAGRAREQASELLERLGDAVHEARLDPLVEDYLVLHVHDAGGVDPGLLLAAHGPLLARALRSERQPLSTQEVDEALAGGVSYAPGDLALVDWNVALVCDRDADAARAVLEFANVQLLEMRFLDRRLDESLDRSWDLLRRPRLADRLRGPGQAMERVARLHVDAALLYERVTNALKLLGDQYLARLWERAARRLRLSDWNAAILHKLQVLDGVHGQLADRAATLRLEALEWIVIALIALSILLSLH